MLRWAVVFLVIAIIGGILGFTGIAESAASIAKAIFFVFTVLFAAGFVLAMSLVKKK